MQRLWSGEKADCYSRAALFCKRCSSERAIRYIEKQSKRENFPLIQDLRCGFSREIKLVSYFDRYISTCSGYRNRCEQFVNSNQCMRVKLREKCVEVVT